MRFFVMAGVTMGLLIVAGWMPHVSEAPARPYRPRFANADDDALVTRGKQIYLQDCASCHGRSLQGQPLWQLMDEFAGRRAPAHDQTGHTWQHDDEDLFQFTKDGRWSSDAPPSHMPPFGSGLSDGDILAALAFIKRSWPLGLRISQAMLNPDHAGLPPNAANVDWRLPPTTCRGTLVLNGSTSLQ